MARADRRRAAREARHARARPTTGRARVAAEQDMFFPKLRAQAKWVFVFLALVFGFGFVFFGVGSGSSGISDLLQGNFSNLFGGSSASKDADNARDELGRLAGTCGGFDDERLVERVGNGAPCGIVRREIQGARHRIALNA